MSMGMHVPDNIGFVINQSNKAMLMIEETKEELKKEAEMAKENNKEEKKEVDLYDPKFVHFDWDEELQGKKAFHCDEINGLKYLVRTFDRDAYHEVKKSSNLSYPFQIDTHVWKFTYYDPHYEVKWAYFKERKPVQLKCKRTVTWYDVGVGHDDVSFFEDDSYDYRLKPEEPKPEPKPNVKVDVDVKVSDLPNEKVEITINGKKCVFENAEQAKKVLFDGE